MEHKTFPAFLVKADEAQGIIEHIVAVMGNIDLGDDVIHPGAFAKTITERVGKIRVLDQHQTDSVLRTLGKPLEMKELPREKLPKEILEKHPEATGGLYVKTQFNMKTFAGKEAFLRYASGELDEWSIGYDPMDIDYSSMTVNGKKKTVRNLRTVKLYEYSSVLFGMNPATSTLSAKAKDKDAKPYDAIQEGDKWNVYKLDADGKPIGKPLGEHESEPSARDQVRALYAEGDKPKADEKEMTPYGPVRRLGDVLTGILHQCFTAMCDDLIIRGVIDLEQRKQLSSLIGMALDVLTQGIPEEIATLDLNSAYYGNGMMMMALPLEMETKVGRVVAARNMERLKRIMADLQDLMKEAGMMDEPPADDEDDKKLKDKTDKSAQAGPVIPPTDASAIEIELALAELNLMEV